jgi:Tol biopolymer transport system component
MSRQFWVVLMCLVVFSRQVAEAQDEPPPVVVYAVETPDDNIYGYTYDLYALNPDTNETLFEAKTEDDECFRAISPNRQWLLYSIYSPGSSSASQSYTVDLHTGESIALGDAQSARWSADSQRLIYSEFYDSGQNVYIFDVQAQETQSVDFIMTFSPLAFEWIGEDWVYAQVVENRVIMDGARQVSQSFDGEVFYFAFSPDAQWIAVVAGEGGDRYLFAIDTNTGETQQIVDTVIGGVNPVWSPDGNWLSYTTDTGIYLWDAVQQTSRQLLDSSENAIFTVNNLIWSPNSRYLAYREYVPGGTQNTQFVLQMVEVETGEIQFVRARIDTFTGELSWVSDTQLAYTYADSETAPDERIHDVYLYDTTTGESVNLTNSPEIERFICLAG